MTDEFKLGDKAVKSVKLHTAAGVAKATPDSCHMNRGDLLAWYSGDGGAYTVQFKADTPFGQKEFQVPVGGAVVTAPVRLNEPGHGAKYEYRVFPGGVDPDVSVDD
jgi:hypothetical protein